MQVGTFSPDDSSAQPALLAQLAADGLTTPDPSTVKNALYNDVCDASTGQIVQVQSNEKRHLLGKRNICDSWFGESCGEAASDAAW